VPDDPQAWALVVAGAGLGALVQGVTGFAYSIVALSLWAWALAPEVAAPLAVLGALTGQLISLASIRRGFEWRRIAPFVLGGAFGVPMGVFVLHNIDPVRFRLVLGVVFTLYAVYGLAAAEAPKLKFGGRGLDAFVGGIGGVLGGLGGISGSVPAIWTQMRGWKRDLRRATMQVYNIAMHVLTLTIYGRTHALNATSWKLFGLTAPLLLIASFYGARVYRGVSERVFARLVLALIAAAGLTLAIGAARALWRAG
jgi:uncharacterized membrane protein YfcA